MRRRIALTVLVALVPATAALADRGEMQNFRAHLTGDQEVPARATQAVGQTVLQLDRSGDALTYKLIVSNIDNVVASHIHLAEPGQNGAVVAWLAGPYAAAGGRHDGVLAEGTITEAQLVGPLAGHALEDLVAALRSGAAYVNVHTNDGVGDANTGPGDFAAGEVRGQIEAGGPPPAS